MNAFSSFAIDVTAPMDDGKLKELLETTFRGARITTNRSDAVKADVKDIYQAPVPGVDVFSYALTCSLLKVQVEKTVKNWVPQYNN